MWNLRFKGRLCFTWGDGELMPAYVTFIQYRRIYRGILDQEVPVSAFPSCQKNSSRPRDMEDVSKAGADKSL